MKRKTYPKLTLDDLINMWLVPFYGVTIQELAERDEWKSETDSRRFYKTFPVNQEQHDIWFSWAIYALRKDYKMTKKLMERRFCFDYLNCSPSVKE